MEVRSPPLATMYTFSAAVVTDLLLMAEAPETYSDHAVLISPVALSVIKIVKLSTASLATAVPEARVGVVIDRFSVASMPSAGFVPSLLSLLQDDSAATPGRPIKIFSCNLVLMETDFG